MRIELIEWLDAGSHVDWQSLEKAMQYEPEVCQTVGWVLVDNDKQVTLVQSHGRSSSHVEDEVDHIWVIPTGCIISRKVLDDG